MGGNHKVESEGYSKLSQSSTLRKYISLPSAFDQSAQLVLGGGSDIAGQSFFIGHDSASAQCPAASLWVKRQLKHFGGHKHWRILCFPQQLNPEWSEVL